MPILQLSMRSQDLDNANVAATELQPAVKTFRLQDTFKFKYLKLLHVYTNLSSENLIDGGDSSNTIIYARISFLNEGQSVFFESKHKTSGGAIVGQDVESRGGFICLGKSVDHASTIDFRDMYKLLHNDSKNLLYINQPFTVELFKLKDVAADDNDVGSDGSVSDANVLTYNLLASHTIEPITIKEMRGSLNGAGQFLNLIFEYENDDTK